MSTTEFEAQLRHARLFGTDCVLESVHPSARPRLQVELEAIDAARRRRRFEDAPARRRRSPAETVAIVWTLRAEGLVPAAIANKMGLSDQYVRKCLKSAPQTAWLNGKNGTETEAKGIARVAVDRTEA